MIRQNDKWWLIIFVICLIPLFWLFYDIAFNRLGSNPTEALHIRLGDWALRFLWLTLLITPLQTISHWRGMSVYRRLFGLYTFFYASLHVLDYLIIDNYLDWRIIGIDILESTYIWFGVLAYIIIFLLAITSFKYAQKLLGKNWKNLHRFIYVAAIAAMLHYFLQLKGNLAEPFLYLITIVLLLGFRVVVWYRVQKIIKKTPPS
jgi:sulfoxide reductase heme-binding subunit YedZ